MFKSMSLLKKIGLTLLTLLLIVIITIGALWRHEIGALMSFKEIIPEDKDNAAAPVYMMDYNGGYFFDKFIEEGGASNDTELISFVMDNITKGIIPISIDAPNIGCASFTAKGNDGSAFFGRNYDFSTTSGLILRTDSGEGRYATISSVDLQFLGIKDGAHVDSLTKKAICLAAPYAPIDGINEAGVACGIYMTYQGPEDGVTATNQNTSKPDLTSSTLLRLILDKAGSVDEAVALAQSYDLHDSANTSFHYMVSDSTGKSAILEWVGSSDVTDTDGEARKLVVHYNDDDSYIGDNEAKDNFQYVTNFIIDPGYYGNDSLKTGLDRYNQIQQMINPDGSNVSGVVSSDEALKVLKTVGRRSWDKAKGESDSNTITVWSALYDLTNRKVTWVSNESFDDPDRVMTFDFSFNK